MSINLEQAKVFSHNLASLVALSYIELVRDTPNQLTPQKSTISKANHFSERGWASNGDIH